jgi:hypothetical protein
MNFTERLKLTLDKLHAKSKFIQDLGFNSGYLGLRDFLTGRKPNPSKQFMEIMSERLGYKLITLPIPVEQYHEYAECIHGLEDRYISDLKTLVDSYKPVVKTGIDLSKIPEKQLAELDKAYADYLFARGNDPNKLFEEFVSDLLHVNKKDQKQTQAKYGEYIFSDGADTSKTFEDFVEDLSELNSSDPRRHCLKEDYQIYKSQFKNGYTQFRKTFPEYIKALSHKNNTKDKK